MVQVRLSEGSLRSCVVRKKTQTVKCTEKKTEFEVGRKDSVPGETTLGLEESVPSTDQGKNRQECHCRNNGTDNRSRGDILGN